MKRDCIEKRQKPWKFINVTSLKIINIILLAVIIFKSDACLSEERSAVFINIMKTNTSAVVRFEWSNPVAAITRYSDAELYLSFNQPLTGADISTIMKELWMYIDDIRYGYDSVLIILKDKVATNVTHENKAIVVEFLSSGDENYELYYPKQGVDRSKLDRLNYLKVLTFLKLGNLDSAGVILNDLLKNDPGNVEYSISLSEIETRLGNWQSALNRLDRILEHNPKEDRITSARQDILKKHGSNIGLTSYYQNISDSSQMGIFKLDSFIRLDKNWRLYLDFDYRNVQLFSNIPGTNKTLKNNGDRLFLMPGIEREQDGTKMMLSLFSNKQMGGIKLGLLTGPSRSKLNLGVTYHRPYLNHVGAILNDVTRDSIEFGYQQKISNRYQAKYGVQLFKYYDISDVELSRSIKLDFDLKYLWQYKSLSGGVSYRLEAEYVDADMSKSSNSRLSEDFTILTREMHTLDYDIQYHQSKKLYWSASTGYTYDRFNTHAPFFGFSINYMLTTRLSIDGNFFTSIAFEQSVKRRMYESGLNIKYYLF